MRPDLISNRIIIPAGIIFVLLAASLIMMVINQEKLKKAEASVSAHFRTFKKYEETVYLPAIEVLGPEGGPVNLRRDFKGRILVLNIWATWCAPCVRELPELKRLRLTRQVEGVMVISVSIDMPKNLDKVLAFIQKHNVIELAGYHDYKGQLQANLPLRDVPVTFIVSSRGTLLYQIAGEARWSHPDIIDFLTLLKTIY